MFVYIDLSSAKIKGAKFAIYDLQNGRFLEVNRRQVFENFNDLEEHLKILSEQVHIQLMHLIIDNLITTKRGN